METTTEEVTMEEAVEEKSKGVTRADINVILQEEIELASEEGKLLTYKPYDWKYRVYNGEECILEDVGKKKALEAYNNIGI